MKNKLFLAWIVAALPAASAPLQSYTDPAAVTQSFAAKLGAKVEAGETLTPEQIQEQMAPLRRHAVPLAPARDRALEPPVLYRGVLPSVVLVGSAYKCDRCNRWHDNVAGGVVVNADGVIATNYHVVEAARQVKKGGFGVALNDGRVFPVRKILALDQGNDLALLQIDAKGLRPAPLARDVNIGDKIYVLSCPVGRAFTFTEGMISNKLLMPKDMGRRKVPVITITADFAKGSSGSPIFNANGEVIGIVRSTSSVYYNSEKGVEKNLQMVWKEVIPSFLLADLCSPSGKKAEAGADDPPAAASAESPPAAGGCEETEKKP